MACENTECPIQTMGKCSYAITVRQEAKYFNNRKLWQGMAVTAQQYRGDTQQVDAAAIRKSQLSNVRSTAEGYISRHCRRKDYALRNAVQKLPSR